MIFTVSTPRCAVTIRPTREDDAQAYRALRLEGLLAHPDAFGSDHATSAAHPPEYWQERVHRGAGGGHGIMYVADAAGALVGVTALVRNDMLKTRHAGSIRGVYVRPQWRGTGVADALIEACLTYARHLELRLVRLGVCTTNTPAIRAYTRHGFTAYGVEPESIACDGVYHDQLLMARRLHPIGSGG